MAPPIAQPAARHPSERRRSAGRIAFGFRRAGRGRRDDRGADAGPHAAWPTAGWWPSGPRSSARRWRRAACPRGWRAAPGGRGGTLHVRVGSGALALELQHLEPVVIERINTYFGYRAVERLKLVHGPLPAPRGRAPRRRRRRRPRDEARAEALVAGIEDAGAAPDAGRPRQAALRPLEVTAMQQARPPDRRRASTPSALCRKPPSPYSLARCCGWRPLRVRLLVLLAPSGWRRCRRCRRCRRVEAMLAERSLGNPAREGDDHRVFVADLPALRRLPPRDAAADPRASTSTRAWCATCSATFRSTAGRWRRRWLPRCVPPERYFGFIDMLFRDQAGVGAQPESAGRPQGARAARRPVARRLRRLPRRQGAAGGHPGPRRRRRRSATASNSTPTFIINGRKLSGALPFAEFKTAIDEALAKAK